MTLPCQTMDMQVQDKSHPPTRRASRPPCSRPSTRKRSTSLGTGSQGSATAMSESAHRRHGARDVDTPRQSYTRAAAHEDVHQVFSPLLHQRLERERKAESEKALMSMMSSSEAGWAVPTSPARLTDQDTGRPGSSTGVEQCRKHGIGLKEMEKVVSTLHKQNFDLKLELYHRRERQAAMEERMEALETRETKVQQVNDRLVDELEKRDRAVEEAVAMIVALEANLDQLLIERGMVRCVENAGWLDPQSKGLDQQARTIARMPSFLSDKSDKTETLRNVYLGVRGSVATLARLSEGSPEPSNALASPSLSVLSESSFVSVYGGTKRPHNATPSDKKGSGPARMRSASVSRMSVARANSPLPRSSTTVPFRSVSGMASLRSERSGSDCSPKSGLQNAALARNSVQRRGSKQDKRDTLRRVLTDDTGGVGLLDLPPTPDTISTSTLKHMADSNETLSRKREPAEGVPLHGDYHGCRAPDARSVTAAMDEQRAFMIKVPRQGGKAAGFEERRPRTAGDAVLYTCGNAWNSDSDDSDAQSLDSSLDVWLRESAKPGERSSSGHLSPDLFGFPVKGVKGDWTGDGTHYDSNHVQNVLSIQQHALLWGQTPQLPHRRSSLQTGADGLAWTAEKPQEGWRHLAANRVRQGKRLSQELHKRIAMQSPQQQGLEQKRYPPRSGQSGARAGLSRLLRRSTGSSSTSQPGSDRAPSTVDAERVHDGMGVPSRISRHGADEDDDRSGATPPPIMLNLGQQYVDAAETGGAALDGEPALRADATKMVGAAKPKVPDGATTAHGRAALVQQQSGESEQGGLDTGTMAANRRKWLPMFSRSGSTKK